MITFIVQARFHATRLPGKVLKRVAGKTLLEHLIIRLRRAKTLQSIIVATSERPGNEKIVAVAKKLGVLSFAGSEDDVLDRYYQAAKHFKADTIVRITADCPLMDPAVVDKVVNFYKRNQKKFDYVSNVRPPTFPDGMDVEVFSFEVLERSFREAKFPSEREHVTAYIGKHPEVFRIGNVTMKPDLSKLRLTVDEPADFRLASKIFRTLLLWKPNFTLADIVNLLAVHPELLRVNAGINRNEGYITSLKEDNALSSSKKQSKLFLDLL